MTSYVDTSVLLRQLFGEPQRLAEWSMIKAAYASRLILVEIGRVIDRCRLGGEIGDADVERLQVEARRLCRSIDILGIDDAILRRAAGPMPTVVGSLDAIHLATALELAEAGEPSLIFATHDDQLARACRASGLVVVGC